MVFRNGLLDSVIIDGIDVVSGNYLLDYRFTNTNKNLVAKGEIRCNRNVRNALTLKSGMSVVISRGTTTAYDDYIFRGLVVDYDESVEDIIFTIEGRLRRLKYSLFTTSYDKNIDSQAGVPEAIWGDIIEDGGFTASYVTGSGLTLDKWTVNQENRFDNAQSLVNILATWQMYDDFNNNYVRLEPKGYTTYSTALVVGGNVNNIPLWKEDLKPMRNKITINGAQEIDTRIENFTGDASSTIFQLEYVPEDTEIRFGGSTSTNLKVRGSQGADTTTFDYYIDRDLKRAVFNTAPPSTAIYVRYGTLVDRPVIVSEPTSIAYYNITQEDSYNFKDLRSVNDAIVRAQQLINYLSDAVINTELYTIGTYGLKPGILVSVTDENNTRYNGTYVVHSIKYSYPEPYDIIEIGSTDFNIRDLFTSIDARLNAVERAFLPDNSSLTILLNPFNEFYFEQREMRAVRETSSANVLIWSHPSRTWDNYNWGTGGAADVSSTALISLIPNENTFKEYNYDTKYYDSTISSGTTINTSTYILTLAPNSSCYISDVIAKTNNYSNFTISIGNLTGTVSYYISPDGKTTWDRVNTLNVPQTFSTASTAIYYMITNTASTATLYPTVDSFGVYQAPAITITFS